MRKNHSNISFVFSLLLLLLAFVGFVKTVDAIEIKPSTNNMARLDKSKVNKDKEIVSWLIVLNNNEIKLAKLALEKKPNQEIKNYAALMIKDHEENLKQTRALTNKLKLEENISHRTVVKLKKEGKKEFSSLKPEAGKEFEKSYIAAMINGHENALETLNNYLSDAETNTLLQKHIEITIQTVKHHLQKAKMIEKNW